MRIGLDVMGGDFAPQEPIKGAIAAQQELPEGVNIVLIGDEETIQNTLDEEGVDRESFPVVHAGQKIEMDENPVQATSDKKDSSIVKGLGAVKAGKLDAFASAGNTGAVLVASLYTVSTIANITRPAVFSMLPKQNGKFGILLDVGANSDAKPEHLFQFGLLGSIYAQNVLKIDNPGVGLLNIGEEESKGNILAKETHKMMKEKDKFNFVGNVEGRDLFNDKADVIVSDGFTGNIVLKSVEAVISLLSQQYGGTGNGDFSKFDYEAYGGTPILGVNAPVVIGHGISKAKAIANMLKLTAEITKADLVGTITQTFKE